MTEFVIIGLVAAFILCNCFWAYVTHKLINKLMSRSYWEFQQAKALPKTQEQELAQAMANVKVNEAPGPNELDALDEMISKVMPLG